MTPEELYKKISELGIKMTLSKVEKSNNKTNKNYIVYSFTKRLMGSDLYNFLVEYNYKLDIYLSLNKYSDMVEKVMNLLDNEGIEYEFEYPVYLYEEGLELKTLLFKSITKKED